jgi:single-stranded DNA-binding protein
MKLGISIKIDVTKIDKSRIFVGKKGKYIDLTTFIDTDNESEYGDHGFISQSVSKEEKEQGVKTPILGNTKVFYGLQQGNQQNSQTNQQNSQTNQQQSQQPIPDDDIPF